MNTTTVQKNTLPLKKIEGGNVKLILPSAFLASITYMHSIYGKKEWSGVLLYKRESGEDVTNFVFRAEHIYPLALGSTAYVEGGADRGELDVMKMYDVLPEALDMRSGFIHTHHSMDTFFSTTDVEELVDNVHGHDFYLSLIVNMDGRYTARLAFLAETEPRIIKFKNTSGGTATMTIPAEKCIYYSDVDIKVEVPTFLIDRFDALLKAEAEKNKITQQGQQSFDPHQYGWEKLPQGGYRQIKTPQFNLFPDEIDEPIMPPSTFNSAEMTFDKLQLKSFLLKWLTLDSTFEGNFADFKIQFAKEAKNPENLSFYLDVLEEKLPEHLCGMFLSPSIEDIDEATLSIFADAAIDVIDQFMSDVEEVETIKAFLSEYVLTEEV